MKKINTLGLYDSGLGGFSIFQDLKTHFKDLNLVLYADQKNAPYGNKEVNQIKNYAKEAMIWFQKQGISDILIACNTVSAVALDFLKKSFPNLNITGIIDLTVSQVNEGNIVVVSTLATHNSGVYEQALQKKGLNAVSKPLPELVDYIEGLLPTSAYIEKSMSQLEGYDTLILACTHYPLEIDVFKENFEGIVLDSRKPIREKIEGIYQPNKDSVQKVITTGDVKAMQNQIIKLFGEYVTVEKG